MVCGVNFSNMSSWQYSPFGAAGYVSPSITAPVDTLGSQNDIALYWNNAGVDRAVADSEALTYSIVPMLIQLKADISKYWQGLMTSNNSSSNWTFNPIERHNPFTIEYRSGANSASETTKIKETEILAGLEKMGRGKAVSDVMNQEIEVDGVKTTLLKHLMDLVEEYRKDPANARLSEENYNKIWDIVDRYIQNGDLSTQDIKTLLEIARDPDATSGTDDDDATSSDYAKRPLRNAQVVASPDTSVDPIVQNIIDSMYCWGTKKNDLSSSLEEVNKNNILEVLNGFEEKSKFKKRGGNMTLIEKIFDEMNGWDGSTWFMSRDKAKPYVTDLSKKLIERTQELIESGYCDEQTVKDFNELISNLNATIARAGDNKNAKDYKKPIINAFDALVEKLTTVEASVYKEYDKALEEGNVQ